MTAGTDTMRIAVIGAGGVGGSFGAALAKAGNDMTFVARGAHLAAIRARGLSVLGSRGDIHLNPVQATDDPASIGPVRRSAPRALAPVQTLARSSGW